MLANMRIVLWSFLFLSVLVTVGSGVRAAEDSPLLQAAKAGDIARVRELIAAGEDVNRSAGDGSTPLVWAVYNFDGEMARVLTGAGADVDRANNYGVTPLLQASRTGDANMIGILLDAGADPSLTHPEGETPLMAASRSGNLPAVDLLLSKGADVNAADAFQHQTALMWAAAEGHGEVVDVLLAAGADPDIRARMNTLTERQNADHPTGGFTALMWAARNGDEDVVRRLVAGGADLEITNGDGATATMIAIYNDRFDTAKVLIDLGAGIQDDSLYTAVEMRSSTKDQFAFDGSRLRPDHANELTSLDLIEMLLEQGADPHKWFAGQFHSMSMPNSDRFANTPLFRAATASDAEALASFAKYVDDLDQLLVVPAEPAEEAESEDAPAGGRGRGNANEGRTALMAAIGGGRAPGMTGGPGYIRSGDVPWREPGSREPADAIRVLLEAGADPNTKSADGATALHQAVQARNADVVRALVGAGADPALANADGLTAHDIAEGRRPEGEAEAAPAPAPGGGGRGGRGGPREAPVEIRNVLREAMGMELLPEEVPEEESEEQAGAGNE